MKHKILRGLAVVLAAFMVVTGMTITVRAESVYDLLIAELKESLKEPVNTSYLSADKLMLGETLTMVAQAENVNPLKCQYGFYVRIKGMFWMTLQTYSAATVCTWTPEATADYEICIKVKHGTKIAKKYFDIRVTRPLTARSYVSTSYIQQGEWVEMTGLAEGGFGEIFYGFYYKPADEEIWTTLSGYSTAANVRWRPQQAGVYDLCIKIVDEDYQLKEKYTQLTVSPPMTRTPTSFTVTVKSPISSPYFWQCTVDDKNLIGYEVTETTVMEDLKTYVLREYRFTTLAAGKTGVHLSYDTHSGRRYALDYDITVDKHLNYTLNATKGNYFDGENCPEPEQITGSFSIRMPEGTDMGLWKCEISDPLVAETDSGAMRDGRDNELCFIVRREGHFTVTLRCTSGTSVTDTYHLIYNLCADKNLYVTLSDCDGYYEEYASWPEVIAPEAPETEADEQQ